MSFSYFRKHFLKLLKIHHEKEEEHCGCCDTFKKLNLSVQDIANIKANCHPKFTLETRLEIPGLERKQSLARIIAHCEAKPVQSGYYLHLVGTIKEVESRAVVVQDFTRIETEIGTFQDLIFAVYATSEEKTRYYHFIASEKNTTNNIRFVVLAWIQFMKMNILQESEIEVWSDGGPKHFKISPTMYLFSYLAKIYKSKRWRYHFWPSRHGHSVCDAAASHLKTAIKSYISCHHQGITDLSQILSLHVKSHQFFILENIPDIPEYIALSTMHQIKQYHLFLFDGDSLGQIVAMQNSKSEFPLKVFYVDPKDIYKGKPGSFPNLDLYLS